jgi:hypothetical protein
MYIIRYKVINNIRIRRIKVADMYSLSIKWKKSLLKGDLWNVLRGLLAHCIRMGLNCYFG